MEGKNELIKIRRKKRRLRKKILFIIFMVGILITLGLKLPYFKVTSVEVINNKNISKQEVIKLSNIHSGNNIFYIDTKGAKESILSNPYIVNANISRILPNKIVISLKERNACFYVVKEKKFLIIDERGIVLQELDSINNMKLVKLTGVEPLKFQIGNTITNDKKKIKIIEELADLITRNNSSIKISTIDVNNSVDIKVYFGSMCAILGTSENMQNKLNKALNILERSDLRGAKGYVDVSFEGNPVFHIEAAKE